MVVAALVVALATVYSARRPILAAAGRLAVVDDAVARADLIFMLNGGMAARSAHAAALFRQGWADRIVIAQAEGPPEPLARHYPNQTELSRLLLEQQGVPPDRIIVLPTRTTSTAEEARALAGFLRENPSSRVLVVTSDYHTRRTRWLIRRELGGHLIDVRMAAAPERFSPSDWWHTEEGMLAYVEELLKFVHAAFVAR